MGAQTILVTLNMTIMMISIGFEDAATVHIGNAIG